MLLFWLFFGSMTLGMAGRSLGLYHLFWSPEYLDANSPWAYLILGASFGLFTMTFHIASYLYYSIRFPFLATLSSPLFRFSINNSAIPLLYFAVYLSSTAYFYKLDPQLTYRDWGYAMSFFVLGATLTVSLTMSYFFGVNQRFYRRLLSRIGQLAKEQKSLDSGSHKPNRITHYLAHFYSIRRVRPTDHYSDEVILETLQGHHNNASYYFVLLLVAIGGLSYYRELEWLSIPAAASFFLLASFLVLMLAVLHTRLKKWYITGIAAVLLLANGAVRRGWSVKEHRAFGMDYSITSPYGFSALREVASDSVVRAHREAEIASLEKWKALTGERKPLLVLTNVSGGGMRSALFSFEAMCALDQLTQGKYSLHNRMITGASGGMLGASYFREGLIRNPTAMQNDSAIAQMGNQLSRDALNDVVFSLVVGDLFINPHTFKRGEFSYRKDRGYTFEEVINNHTRGYFRKTLGRYSEGEAQAYFPRIIYAPVIVGDGRRLIISSSPASFLTVTTEKPILPDDYDGVEFTSFFRDHTPMELGIASAIRMSATFPYITPLVQLPTDPPIEVIDAGARDNTGFDLSLRYVYMMRQWINRNTSGVVLVQLRSDEYRGTGLVQDLKPSLFERVVRPIGGVIQSFDRMQEYERAEEANTARHWLSVPFMELPIDLLDNQEEIALSWHLTDHEKAKIRASVRSERNREQLRKIESLLK